MKEAFDVLERALIVYQARPSVSTQIPVIEKLRKTPKLFFLDVGLVNYRIGFKEFFSKQSLDNVYQGKAAFSRQRQTETGKHEKQGHADAARYHGVVGPSRKGDLGGRGILGLLLMSSLTGAGRNQNRFFPR